MVAALQAQISSIFGIWDHARATFTTFDVLQLQSARSLESRTGPIRCAKSHRAILLAIWSMVAVPQAQISPIFGIWDHATAIFTTFDVLQLQSGTPLEWCPRPIQYAGSPRDIHFLIRSLAVALEAQTLPIFAFLKSGRPRRCVNMVLRVYINFYYMVGAQPTRTANQHGQPGPPARMASS